MRKIREIIRLKFECNLSVRQISVCVESSVGKVCEITRRAKVADLSWPLPEDLNDDDRLKAVLFPENQVEPEPNRPLPDWNAICRELKRKHVTRELLWQEYKRDHPNGYGYSRFCELLREFKKTLEPVLRRDHKAGEKLFVDWAGMKMVFYENSQKKEASVFVAALGASNYTFADVYRDEKQASWDQGHISCFEFLGGVPQLIVPDNTKTGVTKPSHYEPDLNPNYSALISHYGAAVLPARPYEPTDKAKVETAVQIVERKCMAPLRNRVFHSFGELREAFAIKVKELNLLKFQKLRGTRRQLFEELDKPALAPLPANSYELGSWVDARVYEDYHISVNRHYYSVPYRLIREKVSVRITKTVIEIYHRGLRVASHVRCDEPAKATTSPEHRPPKHAAVINLSRDSFLEKAQKIGPFCEQMIHRTMNHFPHPEMGFRSCAGIIRLAKEFGSERTEKACCKCLSMELTGFRPVKNMLKNNMENQTAAFQEPPKTMHRNVRGPQQFRKSS
jgi:transposase